DQRRREGQRKVHRRAQPRQGRGTRIALRDARDAGVEALEGEGVEQRRERRCQHREPRLGVVGRGKRAPRKPRDEGPGSHAHLSTVVSRAPSSAMWTASRLAGPVALAFSLTRCSLPGSSKKLSPARYTLAGPVAEFCERIAPDST